VIVLKSLLVRPLTCRVRLGERIRRVANLTPRPSSSPGTAWVVTFWSMTSIFGSWPETAFQWSQNVMTSRFWVALDRSAMAWLQKVYQYKPGLFAHWQLIAFT
jgi:hypothetical protein